MTALTDVFTKHRPDIQLSKHRVYCTCSEWAEVVSSVAEADREHAAHVEAELLAAGIVAVQLPAPTDTYNHHAGMSMMGWEINQGPVYVDAIPGGEIRIEFDGTDALLTNSDEAPAFAAALLAAAIAVPTPTPGGPTP